jgi:23S rRNA pseudouridine1911/1915/1917 synthase
MLSPRILTADRGDAGRRLDLVLRRHLTDIDDASRTRVQSWIENGRVTVNGRPVLRVAARAALGDVLAIDLPDTAAVRVRHVMTPEEVALDILYEDDHLLALNKPAGIVVHPSYKNTTGTIMNALLWEARRWPTGQRPSLVGRLDKGTSGLLLVARTAAMHTALQRAMASATAEKEYLAVVYGRVTPTRGDISLRLHHDPLDRRRMVASTTTGMTCLTRYERLAVAGGVRGGLSLVCCRLSTGRTHQIRVHLAGRGWPLVGDPIYGEPRWSAAKDEGLATTLRAFPRQALHAWRVRFVHPASGERVIVEARPPADFEALVRASGLNTP